MILTPPPTPPLKGAGGSAACLTPIWAGGSAGSISAIEVVRISARTPIIGVGCVRGNRCESCKK